MIRLRFAEPDLSDGRIECVRVNFDEKMRWLVVERNSIVTVCNFSNELQTLFHCDGACHPLLLSNNDTRISGGKITLPPESVAILKR